MSISKNQELLKKLKQSLHREDKKLDDFFLYVQKKCARPITKTRFIKMFNYEDPIRFDVLDLAEKQAYKDCRPANEIVDKSALRNKLNKDKKTFKWFHENFISEPCKIDYQSFMTQISGRKYPSEKVVFFINQYIGKN